MFKNVVDNLLLISYTGRTTKGDTMNIDLSRLTTDYPLQAGVKIPEEDLKYLYVELNLPVQYICDFSGKGKRTVDRYIADYKLHRNTKKIIRDKGIPQEYIDALDISRLSRDFQKEPWKTRQEEPIYSDFYYLYIIQNWTVEDIAEYISASKGTVERIIQKKLKLKKTAAQRQESREKSNLRQHGTRHTISMESTREKSKQTNKIRHGVECPLSLEENRVGGMLHKYGVDHPSKLRKKSI